MTDADKADLTAVVERACRAQLAVKDKEEKKEYEDRKAEDGDEHFIAARGTQSLGAQSAR